MSPTEEALKRAFDIAVAGTAIGFLWPLMGAVAVALRLESPGPALFRQERLGRDGRVFHIMKFRTMVRDAVLRHDGKGAVLSEADDARYTRLGKLLRRTSIDELPQLFNVLWGEMSIVGPRPDLPEGLRHYTADERDRLRVKPGITGLAQVSGRNDLSPHEKWQLDAEYARRATLGLDARILVRTVRAVLSSRGIVRPSPRGGSA